MKAECFRIVLGVWLCAFACGCGRESAPRTHAPSTVADAAFPLSQLPDIDVTGMEAMIGKQLVEFRRALEAEPHNAKLNGRMGMLFDVYYELEAAALCYRRACLLNAEAFRWHYYLGVLEQKRGDVGEAVTALEKSADLRPEYVPVWVRLGQVHLLAGALDRSESTFRRALQATPQFAAAYEGLGRVAVRREDHADAVAHFERALSMSPNAQTHYALAQALRNLGRYEEAKRHIAMMELAEPVSVFPDPLLAVRDELQIGGKRDLDEAERLMAKGQVSQAKRLAEGALHSNGEIAASAHFLLGVIASRQGGSQSAIDHYRAALRTRPNDYRTLNNLGRELLNRNLLSEAMDCFGAALRFKPGDALAHTNLGDALVRLGSGEEAGEHFHRAIELDGNLSGARAGLARLLGARGEHAESAEQWREYARIKPDDVNGLVELAMALSRSGRIEEAKRIIDQAVRLEPDDKGVALQRERILKLGSSFHGDGR